MDAQAERQFGLPPGTLSRLGKTKNIAERLYRIRELVQQHGVSVDQLNQAIKSADRHELGPNPLKPFTAGKREYTAGDYIKRAAIAAAPLAGGLAYGALAGGGSAAAASAPSAASVPVNAMPVALGPGVSVPGLTAPMSAAVAPSMAGIPTSSGVPAGAAGKAASSLTSWAPTATTSVFDRVLKIAAKGADIFDKYQDKKAVNKATDQLVEASNQALDESKAAYDPYMQTGGAAMGTLGALMGLPAGAAPGTGPTQNAPLQGSSVRPDGSRDRGDLPVTGIAVPRPVGGEGTRPLASVLEPVAAQQQTQSGFVRMQAPTGDQDDVPVDMVPYFESQGARRIT